MIMQEVATAFLMILGGLFMFVGGVGVVRLPDLYMRVSASTKASTVTPNSLAIWLRVSPACTV